MDSFSILLLIAVTLVWVWLWRGADRALARAGAEPVIRAGVATSTIAALVGMYTRAPLAMLGGALGMGLLLFATWWPGVLARALGGPRPPWKALRERDRVEFARLEAELTGAPVRPVHERIRGLTAFATPETAEYIEAYQRTFLEESLRSDERARLADRAAILERDLRGRYPYDAWEGELRHGWAHLRQLGAQEHNGRPGE